MVPPKSTCHPKAWHILTRAACVWYGRSVQVHRRPWASCSGGTTQKNIKKHTHFLRRYERLRGTYMHVALRLGSTMHMEPPQPSQPYRPANALASCTRTIRAVLTMRTHTDEHARTPPPHTHTHTRCTSTTVAMPKGSGVRQWG